MLNIWPQICGWIPFLCIETMDFYDIGMIGKPKKKKCITQTGFVRTRMEILPIGLIESLLAVSTSIVAW